MRAYIRALELSASYAIVSRGFCRIGCAKTPPAHACFIAWCKSSSAEMLFGAIPQRQFHDIIEAQNSIISAARTIGVDLQSEAELHAAAAPVVDRINSEFERQLRGGELRDLNRRYRDERLARAAEGKGAPSYSAWIANQRVALVKRVARLTGTPGMRGRLEDAIAATAAPA